MARDYWYWEIDGLQTDLNQPPYTVIDYGGIGMPNPSIARAPLPLAGNKITNVRFDARAFGLTLRINGPNADMAQANAEALMSKMFQQQHSAVVREGELVHRRYDGTERRLRCLMQQGLMLNRDTWRTPDRRIVQMIFEASHPWWYANSLTQVSGSTSTDLGYPEFPLEFSGTEAGFSWGEQAGGGALHVELNNPGLMPTLSATISYAGPLTNPSIKHIESGREIKATTTVPSGQRFTVRMGGDPKFTTDQMSVTLEPSGADRFPNLDKLGRFQLWPGRNTIQFSHTGSDTGNLVVVEWRNEYASG